MKVLIRFSLCIREWSFDQVCVAKSKKRKLDKTIVAKIADDYMLNFYGSYTNDNNEEVCNGKHLGVKKLYDYEYFGEITAHLKEMRVITEADYKVLRRLYIA